MAEFETDLERVVSDAACDRIGAAIAADVARTIVEQHTDSVADVCAIEKRVIASLILLGAARLQDCGIYDAGTIYALEALGFAMHRAGQQYPGLIHQSLQLVPRDAMPMGRQPVQPMIAKRAPWWRRWFRR